MDFDLADGLKWYVVFLLSTSCHEAAHAWAAHRLGDNTAYDGGQVSLNPAPHIKREPIGMVAVPLLSYFLGGWMMGWASAPYNPDWARRFPRRAAAMSLAGPAANFSLVAISAFLMRLGSEWNVFNAPAHGSFMQLIVANGASDGIQAFFAKLLSIFFSLNLLLGAFNLLPLPPLDGSNLPFFFLPDEACEKYREWIRHPAFTWIGLFVAWKLFGLLYPILFSSASKLLYSILHPG